MMIALYSDSNIYEEGKKNKNGEIYQIYLSRYLEITQYPPVVSTRIPAFN